MPLFKNATILRLSISYRERKHVHGFLCPCFGSTKKKSRNPVCTLRSSRERTRWQMASLVSLETPTTFKLSFRVIKMLKSILKKLQLLTLTISGNSN